MNEKLLYIGKSNKHFTYNTICRVQSGSSETMVPGNYIFNSIYVYSNKNIIKHFNEEYREYFFENFKFLSEEEYLMWQRKNKLNKLKNV